MSLHNGYLCASSLQKSLEQEWVNGHEPNLFIVCPEEFLRAARLTGSKMMDGRCNPLSGCGLEVASDPNLSVGEWVLGKKKVAREKCGVWVCGYCRSLVKADVWTCPNCMAVRQEIA